MGFETTVKVIFENVEGLPETFSKITFTVVEKPIFGPVRSSKNFVSPDF